MKYIITTLAIILSLSSNSQILTKTVIGDSILCHLSWNQSRDDGYNGTRIVLASNGYNMRVPSSVNSVSFKCTQNQLDSFKIFINESFNSSETDTLTINGTVIVAKRISYAMTPKMLRLTFNRYESINMFKKDVKKLLSQF